MTDHAGLVAVPARRWRCWRVGWLWLNAVRRLNGQAGVRVEPSNIDVAFVILLLLVAFQRLIMERDDA